MIGGNSFYLLMVLGPVIGVIGTVLGQRATAAIQRRTTSGTIETSTATELWAQAKWSMERQDKVIEGLNRRIDELVGRLERVESERDELRKENARLTDAMHLVELELQRLRFAQANAAVTTVTTVVPGHTLEEGQGA